MTFFYVDDFYTLMKFSMCKKRWPKSVVRHQHLKLVTNIKSTRIPFLCLYITLSEIKLVQGVRQLRFSRSGFPIDFGSWIPVFYRCMLGEMFYSWYSASKNKNQVFSIQYYIRYFVLTLVDRHDIHHVQVCSSHYQVL